MLFCVSCGMKISNFAEKIARVHMMSVQFETSLLLIRKLNYKETVNSNNQFFHNNYGNFFPLFGSRASVEAVCKIRASFVCHPGLCIYSNRIVSLSSKHLQLRKAFSCDSIFTSLCESLFAMLSQESTKLIVDFSRNNRFFRIWKVTVSI